MSIAALLQGDNLLLSGVKATGKNVLCETLAWIFGRPEYDISFHVNTDSADLIGTDTFINNEVRLRKGPIYQCAEFGGFGILDEINMAKNDAVSVLHATLDHRRRIDIPGYNRILLHPATRFIGTMNYGYAGTRELNEALVDGAFPKANLIIYKGIRSDQIGTVCIYMKRNVNSSASSGR